ncbi:MAG: hypothetical protein WC732_07335 [Candidatus Omnitrophota bacterium]
MNVPKKYNTLIFAAAGALVVLFVVKTLIGPFHEKFVLLKRQQALQEAKLKKGLALIENKDAINREYARYASYFSQQGFSDEEAVAGFLKQLEEISRASGFLILDIKPQQGQQQDTISKQFQINIKAESDLPKLVAFLHGLYNSPLLFSVEKMVLVPKKEGTSDLSISLTVEGTQFV